MHAYKGDLSMSEFFPEYYLFQNVIFLNKASFYT